MIQALPFRLLGKSRLDQLSRQIDAVLRDWAAAWFPGVSTALDPAVIDTESVGVAAEEWLSAGRAPDDWVAWQAPDTYTSELAELMFGASIDAGASPSRLVVAALNACRSDFFQRMLPADTPAVAPMRVMSLESFRMASGSGYFAFRLPTPLPPIRILCGGAVLPAPNEPSGAPHPRCDLVPRIQAVAEGKLAIEVALGQAELSLGELAQLAVGDVVVLDTPVASPMKVRTNDGRLLASGNLGRYGSNRAIQIDFE